MLREAGRAALRGTKIIVMVPLQQHPYVLPVLDSGNPSHVPYLAHDACIQGEPPYVCDVCGTTFVRKHDGERVSAIPII